MVRVGRVVGMFGVAGAVKVQSLTDFDDRFDPGHELLVRGRPRLVEWSRMGPAGLVLKLRGVDSRAAAEALREDFLEIPDEAARPLPESTWYHHELVGLSVATASGRPLGTITEILERPANDVWVAAGESAEVLVPATVEAVLSVDLDSRRVTVADWVLEVEDA